MEAIPTSPAPSAATAGGTRRRLSFKEKVGYSLGDAASNIYFQTFVVFLPIFYTDVFGISAGAMGTMLLLTRVFDAVNDPMMGVIVDRTHTRWGSFRPYIGFLAVPLAIGGVLAFTTPDLGASGRLIYAYLSYSLLIVLYTAVNVPYSALMGVLTPNAKERAEVSTYRFVAAFVGQFIIGSTALVLVEKLGGGSEQAGWQYTMVVYGFLVVALLLGTFFLTRERVLTGVQQGSVGDDLKDLVRNKPWVLVGAATLFQLTFVVMRGSATPYYFRYFVQDQQLSLFGSTISLTYTVFTSSFVTMGTIATLIGAMSTGLYARVMDRKTTYAVFLIVSALLGASFFWLQPENVLMLYGLNILFGFFSGSVAVLQWAIYTDTADYGEWKFGRRATGLIMAASLFMLKLGLMLGGSLVGWMLGAYGFVPNAPQSPEALGGVRLIMSLYPAIFGVIGGAIMFFYPLRDAAMVTIEQELAQRRGALSE